MRKGQALVVVLLALAVAMTVGLAIVSRNVTEVGVSTTQEESARALEAAESGIEAALGGIMANGTDISVGTQGAKYDVKTTSAGGGQYVSFPEGLLSGETNTLFLTEYNSDGTIKSVPPTNSFSGRLDVCWGDPSQTGDPPALEAELYYYTTTYLAKRLAYDPDSSRAAATGLSPAVTTNPDDSFNCPDDRPYKYAVSWGNLATAFNITGSTVLMRLRMLSNSQAHYLAVGTSTGSSLPVQGLIVESTGKVGETARRVQVFQRYPDLTDVMDYAVFSGGNLVK